MANAFSQVNLRTDVLAAVNRVERLAEGPSGVLFMLLFNVLLVALVLFRL